MDNVAIHLCAENDINGNPRRLYLVIGVEEQDPCVIAAVNEGYAGIAGLRKQYPDIKVAAEITVDKEEYKSWLQWEKDRKKK